MMLEDQRDLDRSYVASSVRLEDGVVTALGWALDRAEGSWRGVTLRVPSLRVLHDTRVLEEAQGRGVRITGEQARGPRLVVSGPFVIYAPDLKSLAEAEEIKQATAIAVVGAHAGLNAWVSAFRPEHLGGEVIAVGDPVVWTAMESFTDLINSSTGLAHHSDRSRVTDGLLKLRRAGHAFDPDELMAAALRLNWRGTAAWELRVLATDINAGTRKKSKYGTYCSNIVEVWRKQSLASGE